MKGLKQEGFAVDHAADGEDGLHLASQVPYDVAIVDIMLPKLDGLSLIEALRRQKINTPVLILNFSLICRSNLLTTDHPTIAKWMNTPAA